MRKTIEMTPTNQLSFEEALADALKANCYWGTEESLATTKERVLTNLARIAELQEKIDALTKERNKEAEKWRPLDVFLALRTGSASLPQMKLWARDTNKEVRQVLAAGEGTPYSILLQLKTDPDEATGRLARENLYHRFG